jgi:myo-inositol-1(or 4)-monophosphatase
MDELYTAERGGGAFLNDRRLRVSGRTKLSDAVIGTGVPHLGRGHHGNYLIELRNVMAECRASAAWARRRSTSPMSPPAASTASGRTGLSPWDIAAGMLMIREAGGFVSDRNGGNDMFEDKH